MPIIFFTDCLGNESWGSWGLRRPISDPEHVGSLCSDGYSIKRHYLVSARAYHREY